MQADLIDASFVRSRLLHLHGFENQQGLAGGNGLAWADADLDNGASHRRVDLVVMMHGAHVSWRATVAPGIAYRRAFAPPINPPKAPITQP